MSFKDKAHFVVMWTVDPDDEGEWDRIFASHAQWMVDHPRQGDAALLSYTVSKGPELSNPLDPSSEATGNMIYVLDEYYETTAGIDRHWQEAMARWADDLGAIMEASSRARVSTMHSGAVIQALW